MPHSTAAAAYTLSTDSAETTTMPIVSDHDEMPSSEEDAAVGRPDRGRVGEDSFVLAGERIVDQQVALLGYLVGVEEVVAPVRSTRLERVRDVPGRGEREPHDRPRGREA